MALEVAHAILPARVHGFEQVEIVPHAGQEARLQLALGIFIARIAVVHDAGADAHSATAHAVFRRLQRQRADRHRQAKVADRAYGLLCRPCIEPAYRAGVDAGLEVEQLAAELTSFVPGRALDDNVQVMLRFKSGARGALVALTPEPMEGAPTTGRSGVVAIG